jgi:hypothetical protein
LIPLSGDPTFGDLSFACNSLDMNAPLEIAVAAGLRSISGMQLRALDGSTTPRYTFTPAALPETTTGCRTYRP